MLWTGPCRASFANAEWVWGLQLITYDLEGGGGGSSLLLRITCRKGGGGGGGPKSM